VLRPVVDAPAYPGRLHPEFKILVASATHDATSGRTAVFALNRDLREEQELTVELRGFDGGGFVLDHAIELHHPDLQACNTQDAPDTVSPRAHTAVGVERGELRARLRPGSWNVFVLSR
jgi:alpha-N-arabinofuranosidase